MQQEPGHIGKLVQTEILLLKVRRLESGYAMMQMMPDAESFSSAVNAVREEQAIFQTD